MAEYKYGTYGRFGSTVAQSTAQASTIPVYFGTAPVNLVKGYAEKGLVNAPVKLTTLAGARRAIGYSDNWESFTLSEVIYAHFNNANGNIGPVYVVNVLDPDTMRKDEEMTVTVTFSNGTAQFASDTIILDTLTITGKTVGKDFTVDYDYANGKVIIESIGKTALDGQVEIKYHEVDASKVTAADIVGGETAEGVSKGIASLELVYSTDFEIPNLLSAPGWDDQPEVYNALVAASTQINSHWDAFVYASMPVKDCDTIAKAVAWKKDKGYISERSKVFWPRGLDGAGHVFHLSTLAIAETMRLDEENNTIPFETCGNKSIPIIKQYFGTASKNNGFGQRDGNELSSNGITTAIPFEGTWAIWGDHTAAYQYGVDNDARTVFDVSMRMMMHITNSFQQEWMSRIDNPMARALRDEILNREQEKLDYYVSVGALIGNPTVEFLETDNAESDMLNGDFTWHIAVTPVPPLKSATVVVAYTDEGFSVYTDSSDVA